MPRQYTRLPLATRFWSKVDTSGECWLWLGGKAGRGYGVLNDESGRKCYAHRIAYVLAHGPIPAGLDVCHNCPGGDNPACVNPAHLFLGTQAENSRDMVRKGRSAFGERHGLTKHPEHRPRGETHGRAILTEQAVREIRRRYAVGGTTLAALGQEYGVSLSMVSLIVRREKWRHIT